MCGLQGYSPPPPQYAGAQYGQQPYPGQPAAVTVQPTVYVTQVPLAHPVKDYLAYSIFTMLCCCMPLGIAALIYSIFVSLIHLYYIVELFIDWCIAAQSIMPPVCQYIADQCIVQNI